MSVGSKVIFLVLAVGLQSLFNGDSIGCAYAKPPTTLIVQDGTNSNDFYKSVFSNLESILKSNSYGTKTIGEQNTVQESQSGGFLNIRSRIDDVNNVGHQEDSGAPGAFTLGTHNTVQISNSNMTTNTGSWITYRNNAHNSN